MKEITYITPNFAVTGDIEASDFERIRALGFKTIISNLPEGEAPGDVTGSEAARLSWQQGLAYRHIPAGKLELFSDTVVDATEDALRGLDGPVLAYCKSGMRSAIVWGAASARNQPVDCVLSALTGAGFDLDFLRDEFGEQSARQRQIETANLLDCSKAAEVVEVDTGVMPSGVSSNHG